MKECANEPKPPRVTWLLSWTALEVLDDELLPNRPWLDDDDPPYDERWPPDEDDPPRRAQSFACWAPVDEIAGRSPEQFSLGIKE